MASGNIGGGGGSRDDVQRAEIPYYGMDAATCGRRKFPNGASSQNRSYDIQRTPGGHSHRSYHVGGHAPAPRHKHPAYVEESYESDEYYFFNRKGCRSYERERRDHGGRDCDFNIEVNIPSFDGTFTVEKAFNWFEEVDCLFENMDISEYRQLELVSRRLKGGALAWWERRQIRWHWDGHPPVRTWKVMRNLMRQNFLPLDFEQIIFRQHQKYQQNNHSYEREGGNFGRRSYTVNCPIFFEFFRFGEFLSWIENVELYFRKMEIPDEQQVRMVSRDLHGNASCWWKELHEDLLMESRAPVKTWERMKDLMQKKFFPQLNEWEIFMRHQKLSRERDEKERCQRQRVEKSPVQNRSSIPTLVKKTTPAKIEGYTCISNVQSEPKEQAVKKINGTKVPNKPERGDEVKNIIKPIVLEEETKSIHIVYEEQRPIEDCVAKEVCFFEETPIKFGSKDEGEKVFTTIVGEEEKKKIEILDHEEVECVEEIIIQSVSKDEEVTIESIVSIKEVEDTKIATFEDVMVEHKKESGVEENFANEYKLLGFVFNAFQNFEHKEELSFVHPEGTLGSRSSLLKEKENNTGRLNWNFEKIFHLPCSHPGAKVSSRSSFYEEKGTNAGRLFPTYETRHLWDPGVS